MPTPTLLFDGECGFCRYWVDYWRELTGPAIRHLPCQQGLSEFPALGAVQYRVLIAN